MKYLVVRLGAFGDNIIVTPLIRYLKLIEKADIIVLTSEEQGQQIFKNNPHIDKLILHKRDSIPNDKLEDYFNSVAKSYECDEVIDLCESIECRLALHPNDPAYKYTIDERREICNKNYYEETFIIAKGSLPPNRIKIFKDPSDDIKNKQMALIPEMFFSDEEETFMAEEMEQHLGKYKVIVGLSGSGRQKTYPTPHLKRIIDYLCEKTEDIIFYMVGDYVCKVLEMPFNDNNRVICKSGVWTMRESILACKYADLVLSPDTGLLHGAGCFQTPKIGLFTNTTIDNVSKHFFNDYSMEAQGIACAPCYHLIYRAQVQTQLARDGMTPLCMAFGLDPKEITRRILRIINAKRKSEPYPSPKEI